MKDSKTEEVKNADLRKLITRICESYAQTQNSMNEIAVKMNEMLNEQENINLSVRGDTPAAKPEKYSAAEAQAENSFDPLRIHDTLFDPSDRTRSELEQYVAQSTAFISALSTAAAPGLDIVEQFGNEFMSCTENNLNVAKKATLLELRNTRMKQGVKIDQRQVLQYFRALAIAIKRHNEVSRPPPDSLIPEAPVKHPTEAK